MSSPYEVFRPSSDLKRIPHTELTCFVLEEERMCEDGELITIRSEVYGESIDQIENVVQKFMPGRRIEVYETEFKIQLIKED